MGNLAYSIDIKEGGRVVIPSDLRQQLGISVGDRLIVQVTGEGQAQLTTPRAALRKVQHLFEDLTTETSLSEELISDRRAEVAGE